MEINYHKIKLIIWDLDECFWEGTLSEGPIRVPEQNKELIVRLSRRGIVNSICTKNDRDHVNEKLNELSLLDYFVFNSINWNPKGERIKNIVTRMKLRAENVLFIDDNIANLREAELYYPELMTSLPDCMEYLVTHADSLGKDDSPLSRLAQYKQLEQKSSEEAQYHSNEEFLYSSGIRVSISHTIEGNEERLYELISRTNQLNFTKRRDTKEEFYQMVSNPEIEKGYVNAQDKFGDYGIIGFYAIEDNTLLHYCFSCRIMGMGIEQYVYSKLSYPKLTIQGPVSGTLDKDVCPLWINISSSQEETSSLESASHTKAIIKGPCDLSGITEYLHSSSITTELYYTTSLGQQVEIQCSTQNIANCRLLSDTDKDYLSGIMPFYEKEIFQTELYDPSYKIVIISLVSDFNFGVYQHKSKNIKVALGQDYKDITDPANWDGYINGEIYNSHYCLTRKQLERFAQDFYKVAYTTKDIIDNIDTILHHLSRQSILVIMLGSDIDFPGLQQANYDDRAARHKAANAVIKEYYKDNGQIRLIEPGKYITSENDYHDKNINHYARRVLYQLTVELCDILNNYGIQTKKSSDTIALLINILHKVKKGLKYYSWSAYRYRLGSHVKPEKEPEKVI